MIDFGCCPPLRSQTLWHAVGYGVSAGARRPSPSSARPPRTSVSATTAGSTRSTSSTAGNTDCRSCGAWSAAARCTWTPTSCSSRSASGRHRVTGAPADRTLLLQQQYERRVQQGDHQSPRCRNSSLPGPGYHARRFRFIEIASLGFPSTVGRRMQPEPRPHGASNSACRICGIAWS